MPKETTNVRIPRELFEEAREATSDMEQRLGFRPSVSQFVEKSIRDSIRRLKAGETGFLDIMEAEKKDSRPPRK